MTQMSTALQFLRIYCVNHLIVMTAIKIRPGIDGVYVEIFPILIYYNSPYMSVCLSVDVSKLQVAVVARSSREMSQTGRID